MTAQITPSSLVARAWEGEAVDQGTDALFARPYLDLDEQRQTPVAHRYLHGGFRGTDTRFSFYLPAAGQYEGRFFQHVTPVPISENLAQQQTGDGDRIRFSIASGAAFVETNGGGPDVANPLSGVDPTIGAYRANAAAARFFRTIAAELYPPHQTYGYLFGGSGGGFRTIGASENTVGVWDGFVPFVIGSPMAMPNVFSVRMHAQRILRDKFPAIVDAYDVGGDPTALDLTEEERDALEEVTRLGFPPRSWFGWESMGMHAFSALYPGVMHMDPSYADDFWTVPGYLGADPDSSVHRDRLQLRAQVVELLTDHVAFHGAPDADAPANAGGVDEGYKHVARAGSPITGIRLSEKSTGWMLGAQLQVRSGAASGAALQLAAVDGDVLWLEAGQDASALALGDEVILDNSSFLAAQTYHRHQVPGSDYPAWDQFRDVDGEPLYPQRPLNIGPLMTLGASGTLPSGAISGKVIVVACLLDREAFPWQADWYRTQIASHLGGEIDERFRLWYIDGALHGDEGEQEHPTRSVEYLGALQTALRQLAAWVEDGVAPAQTSTYEVIDGQVIVPGDVDRGGVQPVGQLTVNGAVSTTVRVGERVTIRIDAAAPHPGVIVEVAPDFAGTGVLGEPLAITPAPRVRIEHEAAFTRPGTVMIAARIKAQAAGNAADPHGRVHNILRARIVVTE